jgi:uncharacterized protein
MQGLIFSNLVEFGRLLRKAGLPIGPAQIRESLRAVDLAGVRSRDDFFWALSATLVNRPEQRRIFDLAFELFWRLPETPDAVVDLERWRRSDAGDDMQEEQRPHAAFDISGKAPTTEAVDFGENAPDQRDSASATELFGDKHFERMDGDELATARRALEQLAFAFRPVLTRRRERDRNGNVVDWRRSFRAMSRGDGSMSQFAYCSRREEAPGLVVLCDISGSMQIYSRIFVHFICALALAHSRTHAFLFGTRLTDISRYIAGSNIDRAVDKICATTHDFDGGTRIGSSLAQFNKKWSRRLLSRNATVLLMTDGLEGDDVPQLEGEIDRLHRSCRHLMWLNPLLRFAGFEAKAAGVRVISAHVDSLHPMHTLAHLTEVAEALRSPAPRWGRPTDRRNFPTRPVS